jgi:hypothetical protein
MNEFQAGMLIVSELIDEFQAGEKPSEYAVLFGQINSVTAAEGAIMGTSGYAGPYIMKYMLYILYILYLFLLLVTDLIPNNEWNASWIVAILCFTTIAFYEITARYGNPMKLRTRWSGQKPFVPEACRGTEIAITSIFARAKSTLITDATTGAAMLSNGMGGAPMRFSLGVA